MVHVDELQKSKELQQKLDECQQENQEIMDLLLTLKDRVNAIHMVTMIEVNSALNNPINQNAMAILRTVALISLDAISIIEKTEDNFGEWDELPF